jgi:hypothetical protein
MPRVVVVGQPGEAGPLPCSNFVEMLSRRLDIPALTAAAPAEVAEQADWIAAEAAGTFSEPLFRKAETVVWLHFSPLPYLADWFAHQRERLKAFASEQRRAAARARWGDVATAFRYLVIAPEMYELFSHPALAHVQVVELRSPREAEFWLMTQKRRRLVA